MERKEHPKINCYQACAGYMFSHGGCKRPDLFLCHGIVTNLLDRLPMGHAWLEEGRHIFDPHWGFDRPVNKYQYYSIGKIKSFNVVKFDFETTLINLIKIRHYGPWGLEAF